MIKKRLIPFIICLLVMTGLFIAGALAETYTFSDMNAQLTLPSGSYTPVVTAGNMDNYLDYLTSKGYDTDQLAADFQSNGLKMIAFDDINDRRFVLTAQQDVDAQQFFDLNEQDEAMRKTFRVAHTDGTTYAILGYTYSSATWKNYGGTQLRFLQTRYTLRRDGSVVCTGGQRRTIRNGYTITLDMQVYGRTCTDTDIKALETIMKTFDFTQVLPMPQLPVKLILSSEPPQETHDDVFTIKGTSAAKAAINVTVISISGTSSTAYTAAAGSGGSFSVKVTLPSRGTYAITITASKEGDIDNTKTYSVSYDPNRIIASMSQTAPDELTDTTVLKGTTEAGVTTQLIVSGPVSYTKTSTSRSFSFTVDTSKEGTYTFRLVMTKKHYNERTFEYSGTRSLSDSEKKDQIRNTAIKPEYTKLIAQSASYNGQLFGYTGYLIDLKEGPGDYLYTVALSKSGSNYKNIIYINSDNPVLFSIGAKVKVYAEKTGDIVTINSEGKTESIPQFDLLFMESAE